MKNLKVINADPKAKAKTDAEFRKTFIFNVISPERDRFQGPILDLPDFDGSPRLLPADMIGSGGRAA